MTDRELPQKKRVPVRVLIGVVAGAALAAAGAWVLSARRSGPPPPVLAVSSGPTADQSAAVIQAARERPTDPVAQLALGSLLAGAGRRHEAIPPLLVAARDKRTAGAAAVLLAECADDPSRTGPALQGSKVAVEAAPNDPRAWEGLIRCHFARGDRAAADAALQTALRRFPNVARLRFILAERLEQDGDVKEAVRVYGAALKQEPDPGRQLQLAFLLARMQTPDAARVAFQKAVELDPSSVGPYLGLCKTNLELGLVDEAEKAAYSAIQVAPEDPEGAYLLARVLITRGDAESIRTARELLERVLVVKPAHDDAPYQLALCHFRQGSPRQAAALLSRVVAESPDRFDARQNLGKALRQAGDIKAAEEQERLAAELAALEQERTEYVVRISHDPRNPKPYCDLGDFYMKHGAREKAASTYARALALDSRYTRAREGLARAQQAP